VKSVLEGKTLSILATILTIGGWLSLVLGIVIFVLGLLFGILIPLGHGVPPNENKGKSRLLLLIGGVLMGIGAVSIMIGTFTLP